MASSRDEVIDGLARVQRQIDERERDLPALYERRTQLMVDGRALDPPMLERELASAAGIRTAAVTAALAKHRRQRSTT